MPMNIDDSRSYATEEALHKAIRKYFGDDVRYLVVCNRAGRFTAIFSASFNPNHMPIHFANRGFKVFN